MKRLFALTVVLFGLAGLSQIAFAGPERLEAKEMKQVAPAPPPPCDWTGFYIGAHIGYGGGDLTWKDVDADPPGSDPNQPFEILSSDTAQGVFGGGQIGYNRQFGSWLVLGIEADGAWSDVGYDESHPTDTNEERDSFSVQNDWNVTVAARLGFTSLNNRLLTYIKGGAAISHWTYDWNHDELNGDPVDTFNTDETRACPMVGFGFEYAITCHWSAKIEYKHLFLETDTITGTRIDHNDAQDTSPFAPIPEAESYDTELHQDSVLVGINYKF